MYKLLLTVTMMLYISCNCSAANMVAVTPDYVANVNVVAEKELQRGDRGDAVYTLQKNLALAGYYDGDIDGIFGAETQKAVINAQSANNLGSNGRVSAELLMLIRNKADSVSRGGVVRTMQMNVSAYSSADPGCGQFTYRGTHIHKGLCAVDPSVIPLGTRLYIPGYGIAVADDIGSAIKGARLDVAFESRYDAINFGRKSLLVFILK